MCFHSKQTKLALEVEKRFKAKIDHIENFKPTTHINGFDFPQTPIIIDEAPEVITHFNWGLIPSWAKDEEIRKMTLNAKIETVDEKPSFRNSINKRCLVIANGFYEWHWNDAKGKSKTKYEIGIPNEDLFAFAGIYSQWTDTYTGEIRNTYAILTTEANPLMAEIHNNKKRMPVVLHPEDERKWLQHEPIQKFAFPYQANLIAHNLDNIHPSLFD
ncbi:SOS response-associated peptidase [Flavobacterium chuncheonense]|uniref:Abasic site processing protein n=1 Tax=Flavobacterium chuncheonense TaxID=2026653 RepID=A0ABW5YLU3_9FLAO